MAAYNPFNEKRAGKVPADIASNPNISDKAIRVYAVLSMFAGRDGECYPGEKKIAEHCGKSIRRTRDALLELAEFGLIKIERVEGKRVRKIIFTKPDSSGLSNAIEPDDIDLSTPDDSVLSIENSPDTFDQLTGQFCPSSPDTFDQPYIKELKHSLKHTGKTIAAAAACASEPKPEKSELAVIEIDTGPPLFEGGPKPPPANAADAVWLSWHFHEARFKLGDLFYNPYEPKHIGQCQKIIKGKARGDIDEVRKRANILAEKASESEFYALLPGTLLSHWERLANLPESRKTLFSVERANSGLREHLEGLKSGGSGG